MTRIKILDKRSADAEDYEELNRRGQMKRSWQIGVDAIYALERRCRHE